MIKPIEKALEKVQNRFLLTTVVARRWENLVAGAPPLVEPRPGHSKVDTVFDEIIAGRVRVDDEQLRIELDGEPRVEAHDEPQFSSALPTDADDLKQAIADDRPAGE